MSIFKREHEEHLDQLAGYRPTDERPRIMNPDKMTDADWAADQARLALEDGRYRLAAAFANLAHRAELAAAADANAHGYIPVPMAGQTRQEWPRDADGVMYDPDKPAASGPPPHVRQGTPTYAKLADEVRQAATEITDQVVSNVVPFDQGRGPTGNGDRDLAETAQLAKTELFGQDKADTVVRPAPQRCRANVTRDGVWDECGVGIYWAPGHVGEQPQQAAWRHVDPAADADHPAYPGSNSRA